MKNVLKLICLAAPFGLSAKPVAEPKSLAKHQWEVIHLETSDMKRGSFETLLNLSPKKAIPKVGNSVSIQAVGDFGVYQGTITEVNAGDGWAKFRVNSPP